MRVALRSLGCRLNEAELERWAGGFLSQGCELTPTVDDADLVVVNTCAVTREAAKKSRQLIRRARRRNAAARLVVSGCCAALRPRLDAELDEIDLVVDNAEKDRLVDILRRRQWLAPSPGAAGEAGAASVAKAPLFARGRNRAFIKVQDGCRHKCTFCIVTVARGAERSRSMEDVVAEINGLCAQGVLEAVLTGVHIGGYGHDLGTDLPTLVRRVLAETDVPRVRLGSVEPWNLDDDFFDLFADARFMPHLHLPLQSGSDTVLRRMGRRCNSAAFERLARRARDCHPDMNLTTDVIAGFPGETAEEWRDTMDFCRRLAFSHVHVFPYSRRDGTRAATLPRQTPATVIKQRSRQLRTLARRLGHDFMGRYAGRAVPVLVESDSVAVNGARARLGYSHNYLRAALPAAGGGSAGARPNTIVTAHIQRYDEDSAMLIAAPPG